MLAIIEFLKLFSGVLRSGKMSYADALTRFRAQYGRPPDGLELSSIRKEVEKAPSNVFDLTGKQIDTSRPIIGGKNVAETEAQVKERLLKTQQETLERLRNKKKTVEDFSDDGDFDPGGMASGGIARVGMAGGGILKEFIEMLFIKASNDIRQGKGIFKGLDQKQKIVQHDNLTKLVEQFQKTGKFDKKANEYFGIDAEKAFADAEKQVLSKPTKTLEGLKKEETIDISDPEVADEFSRFIKESDPKGYKDLEQKIQLESFDVKDRKKNASGGIAGQLHLNEGGRVPMIFGGSAGLKAMIASIKAAINKGRKDKVKTLFPKYSADEKELLKLGEKYLPRDAAALAARETAGKAEGVQVLIDRLKNDKKIIEQMAKNKAMNDPGLDFMMKHLEKMENMYPPNLKKYTDIDKDILDMEMIKKKLLMKDLKLNAEGGRASLSNGGLAKILGV